ncbi:hypothetical protein [Atopomonas sediminilitoris]|uniref:hypothetical protein n=1 Tax=Atopomonas sediminilitoris TaxID=2919919 RepID=UPI001F4E8257|nr:hypothetical protein [Atopomonas sediminilitoris]MCJ8170431.1 hypothetical protein [Atopomonas sediminilitoris]
MKAVMVLSFLLLLQALPARGEVAYLTLDEGLDLSRDAAIVGCDTTKVKAYVDDQYLVLEAGASKFSVDLDDIPEGGELIVGDITGVGGCDFAVPYGKSDVNESYTLFLNDPLKGELVESKVGLIVNPDFGQRKIISSYRDMARWHEDTLCYSASRNDYFLCKKKVDIDDFLARENVCGERSCGSPKIIYKSSLLQAFAVVSVAKARLNNRVSDGFFEERKGYLVGGDKVLLLDFFQAPKGLYYKVEYSGGVSKVEGWILSSQLIFN